MSKKKDDIEKLPNEVEETNTTEKVETKPAKKDKKKDKDEGITKNDVSKARSQFKKEMKRLTDVDIKNGKNVKLKKTRGNKKTVAEDVAEEVVKDLAKPVKVLSRKQNILIWTSISVLGVATGGGIGAYIAMNITGSERVLEDTSKYLDSFDEIYKRYIQYRVVNNPEAFDEFSEEMEIDNFDEFMKDAPQSTNIEDFLSITDILQVAFYNLEKEPVYVTESVGTLNTKPGLGTQYLTSVHGRNFDEYYYENDSTGAVSFGTRYYCKDGENIEFHNANTKNLKDTERNGKHFIQCTFDNNPSEKMTDSHYAELYGCSIKDPCIYLISSKTYDKGTDFPATLNKLDSNNELEIKIRFTKKACQDYITQIINSSGGKVTDVTTFPYSDWVIRLDADTLLPQSRDLSEMYITKALGLNVTCTSHIEEQFYYHDVQFPEPGDMYYVKLMRQ